MRRGFRLPTGGGMRHGRRRMRPGGRSFNKIRLIIGLGIAAFALMNFLGKVEKNPYTGKRQAIGMNEQKEIALGLQAAPQMIQQHGGQHPDPRLQDLVDRVGQVLVNSSNAKESPYQFDFHLLADPQTVNAFALPGGQIFITYALYSRLQTEGQLAGVLGHEIGHVLGKHSAARMAKTQFTQGLMGAVLAGAGDVNSQRMAGMIGNMINMKYGRGDELESDFLGIKYMVEAGYDPRSMKGVMEILKEASGDRSQPEFMSTHPDPGNRIGKIEEAIKHLYPNGLPSGLKL